MNEQLNEVPIIPYKVYTQEWIKKGKQAYQHGQKAMLNGLLQNAIEVKGFTRATVRLSGNEFSIWNDGQKAFTMEDARSIFYSEKVNQIGRFGEETKLAIAFTQDKRLWITSKSDLEITYQLELEGFRIITPSRVVLPLDVKTEVFGNLEEQPCLSELESFLQAIHGINLFEHRYEIIINDNGTAKTLRETFPNPPPMILQQTLAFGRIKDHITIYLWRQHEWKGPCPYDRPNGLYLATQGVLITWKALWGTSAVRGFVIIDDTEGRIFSNLVTRDKQVPNEKAPEMAIIHKLWNELKSQFQTQISISELEARATAQFRKMMAGGSSKPVLITSRKQTYLYVCPKCGFEQRTPEPRNDLFFCPKCGTPMERKIEKPNQSHFQRKYTLHFIEDENYRSRGFIEIGDPLEGRLDVNRKDPLFGVYKDEFNIRFKEIYHLLLELGTTMRQENLTAEELNRIRIQTIATDNEWRKAKRKSIKDNEWRGDFSGVAVTDE